MLANLSYFRLRRTLFDEFVSMTTPPYNVISFHIDSESFLVIRHFLTVRNDCINDDKRLSFDKAILQILNDAQHAIDRAPVSHALGPPSLYSSAPDVSRE
jgi:hypothetical protein